MRGRSRRGDGKKGACKHLNCRCRLDASGCRVHGPGGRGLCGPRPRCADLTRSLGRAPRLPPSWVAVSSVSLLPHGPSFLSILQLAVAAALPLLTLPSRPLSHCGQSALSGTRWSRGQLLSQLWYLPTGPLFLTPVP